MAHYQFQFINHLTTINSYLHERGAIANISLPGGALRVQSPTCTFDLQPQFIALKEEGRRLMLFQPRPDVSGFAGWRPYGDKRWLEAYSKKAFKEFARKNGVRTPDYYVTPGSYRDVIIKRDRSSFSFGMRGPFRQTSPDSSQLRIEDGEYYEQFILGRVLKAWFWNGRVVCVELNAMAHVIGDGRRTIAKIARLDSDRVRQFDVKELVQRMVEYQGKQIDSVLQEGEKIFVDYRYGSPLAGFDPLNQNVLPALNASLRDQLDTAGRIFEQSIPTDIRANTAFSVDGIVDEQDRIWFLEINSNPNLHPDVYPAMLDSLLSDLNPTLAAPSGAY